MSELRQLQKSFYHQLLGQNSNIVEAIESTDEATAEQRLSIYESGYRLRLKEAITTDYERLNFYLGDEMFEQLLDAYVDKYQSHHTSLRFYSQYMNELLAQTKPFSNYPEILEIAKIEQAFNHSFDAKNCTTININEVKKVKPEEWPNITITLHSSITLLNLKTNSFPIWKALSEEQTPPELITENTVWAVWRKDLVSHYKTLEPAEAQILKQAIAGANFTKICESLAEYTKPEEVANQAITYLQSWINDKMVCELS